ncbi:MAG: mitochondrial fission ELM1 family protein [Rickettsiales bacterium]
MEPPVPVWGLVDDRTGHTGQVLGVIGKLGLPFVLKRLAFNWKTRLPLTSPSLTTLNDSHSAPIAPPWPKLVITAGRRTIPIARYIKKKSPSTIIVYLMWSPAAREFDLVAVPQHDEVKAADNIITTIAPLHAVTPETLAAAKEAWLPKFNQLPRPWVAVTIGGNTKQGKYHAADWRELITRARDLAPTGTLMVTTSRRTPKEALDVIAPLLAGGSHILHRWDADKDNPYLGLLGCADAVIATGDSLSMCTEACVSGKPVYIFAPEQVIPKKHARLHQSLYAQSLAKPLDANSTIDWKPARLMDDAGLVAAAMKARFPQIRG